MTDPIIVRHVGHITFQGTTEQVAHDIKEFFWRAKK